MKKEDKNKRFLGFPPKPSTNFWSYPKEMDKYWHQISGSEQKVLDYILRHTWGFNKTADEISLTQLQKGIRNFDGGTGLTRQTIIIALKGLIKKRFISKKPGNRANCYQLVQNLDYPSQKNRRFVDQKIRHTIEKYTIKKESTKYTSHKKRPYYDGQEMRKDKNGKQWVIPKDGGSWLEFAGSKDDIEWK